jgi:hypothetical protein
MSFLSALTPMESNETFDDTLGNEMPEGESGSFSLGNSKMGNYGSIGNISGYSSQDPRRHSVSAPPIRPGDITTTPDALRHRSQSVTHAPVEAFGGGGGPPAGETLEQKIARVMAGINSPAMKYTPSISSPAGATSSSFADSFRKNYTSGSAEDAQSTPAQSTPATVPRLMHAVSTPISAQQTRPAPASGSAVASPRTPGPGYVPVASPRTLVPAPPPIVTNQPPTLTRVPLNPDGTPVRGLTPVAAGASPRITPKGLTPVGAAPPRGLTPVPAGVSPRVTPKGLTPVRAAVPSLPLPTYVPPAPAAPLPRVSSPVSVETSSGNSLENRVPFGGSPPKSVAKTHFNPGVGIALSPRDSPRRDSPREEEAVGPAVVPSPVSPSKKRFSISSLFRAVSLEEDPEFADTDATPSQSTPPAAEPHTPHTPPARPEAIDNLEDLLKLSPPKEDKEAPAPARDTLKRAESLDEKIERLQKDVVLKPAGPQRRNSERSFEAGRPPPSPKLVPADEASIHVAGVPVRRPSIGFKESPSPPPQQQQQQQQHQSDSGSNANQNLRPFKPEESSPALSRISTSPAPSPTASEPSPHSKFPTESASPLMRPAGIVIPQKAAQSKPVVKPPSPAASQRTKDDDDLVSRADQSVATRGSTSTGSKKGGTITAPRTAPAAASTTSGNGNDRWRAADTETIRDGDFSMRTRNTNATTASGQKSVNKGYVVGNRGRAGGSNYQDPTQYSYDNWSLSRQMKDDDISSVGIRSEAGARSVGGGGGDDSALVKVVTRVRPFSVGEVNSGCRRVVSMNGDKVILVNPSSFDADPDTISAVAAAASLEKMRCNDWAKVFRFDNCLWSFDPMNMNDDAFADQTTAHEEVGQDLVRDMLRGTPVTCFAYGHTGTGKTYTMFGPEIPAEDIDRMSEMNVTLPSDAGLIPRVFTDIIQGVYPPEADMDYESDTRITISFLEIYQERIRDLLNTEDDMGDLRIREHPSIGPYVENLAKIEVRSPIEMLQILQAGNSERTISNNRRNGSSSRSHVVVTLEMTPYDAPAAPYALKTPSKGNGQSSGYGNSNQQKDVGYEFIRAQMIDLAGSETDLKEDLGTSGGIAKWKTPKSRDESNVERVELKMIRKSLSTLGYIIRALAQGLSVKGMPFRDSSLTWMLKDALSGNCALTMVSTVSPSDSCYDETLNTLKYAERLCALGGNHGNPGAKRGAVNINDTIDPQLTFALASEFKRLREELGGASGSRAARQLLKQTVSDPQQRLAKLSKEDPPGTGTKRRNSGSAATPGGRNNQSLIVASPPPNASYNSGIMIAGTPSSALESNSLSQLRETYRQLHGRFIELQIELENARTDRDGLNLEMQSLRDALQASKNGTATKPQNRLFQTPATDMSAALLAAEDEIAELKAAFQRKEESSDRMLNELASERQIRSTIERTAKAQVVDLIARVESLHKQTAAAKDEAESCAEEALAATRAKADAESTVSCLKAEILKSREEINLQTVNLETVIDSLRRQLNELIKERELMGPHAKQAQLDKDEMLLKMQSMVSRIDELNGKLETCYKQLGRTESDLKEAAKEKANWMDRENAWVRRIQEMQSTLERVERDKSTLLGREGSLTKQVLDMEMAMAGGEAKYRSQLDAMTLERDSLVEIVKQQGQALHVQQQQSDTSLKMLYQRQGALERIENQTVDAKVMDELSRLQDELHGIFSREGKTLQSELHDAKQLLVIVASMKDKLGDMDLVKEELNYEQKERRRLENKLADLIEEAATEGKEHRDRALVESAVLAQSMSSSEMNEMKDQVEHYKKISTGWESRSQYWQQIAKKQIGGGSSGGNMDGEVNGASSSGGAPDLNPVHLKGENERLTLKLAASEEEASQAKQELAAAKEDMQKEFTSLWLAVQKLNSIDAEKEKAMENICTERDVALREKDSALDKLKLLEREYQDLQGELEAIDSDLIRAADEEGIRLDSLDYNDRRSGSRSGSQDQNRVMVAIVCV